MNARRVIEVVVLLSVGGLVGGCASVQVKPVSVAQVNDPAIAGVRFFQPQPYLLITEMPARPTPPMPMMGQGMMRPPMGPMGGPNSCPMMYQPSGGPQHGPGKSMMERHNGMKGPGGQRDAGDMQQTGHHHDMAGMMGQHGQPGHHGSMMMEGHKHGPKGLGGPMMGHNRTHAMPMRNGMMHRMAPQQQRIFEMRIIYLPDYSHPYVANIKGGLGRSPNSIILANGWELLALNIKGHVAEPRPIHAMSAAPAMPQGGMMMHHRKLKMMADRDMNHSKPGQHKKAHRDGKHWGQHGPRGGHGMMMHPMMMPRHAAMAMGLQPGLYRFVFNAKTGKLEGLRHVRLLKAHHWHGHGGMMKSKKSKRHGHDSKPMKSSISAPAGQ